jgi:hypothetical protein
VDGRFQAPLDGRVAFANAQDHLVRWMLQTEAPDSAKAAAPRPAAQTMPASSRAPGSCRHRTPTEHQRLRTKNLAAVSETTERMLRSMRLKKGYVCVCI